MKSGLYLRGICPKCFDYGYEYFFSFEKREFVECKHCNYIYALRYSPLEYVGMFFNLK